MVGGVEDTGPLWLGTGTGLYLNLGARQGRHPCEWGPEDLCSTAQSPSKKQILLQGMHTESPGETVTLNLSTFIHEKPEAER